MADIQSIRYLHFVEGWSLKRIAKTFHHSRKTIRKYLSRDDPEGPKYHGGMRSKPKLGPYADVIKGWLAQDEKAPRKQRHTARRIHERLVEELGAQISESSVRRLVRELRPPRQVYVPLHFPSGVQSQVDWGEDQVIWNNQARTVQVFYIRLAASGAAFAMAFLHQNEESFLEGHVRGLDFLGGVTQQMLYDNTKTALKRFAGRHERELQADFARLVAHYVFKPVFANPYAGNEKGLVENLVRWGHRHLFTPVPRVSNLAELNQLLLHRCLLRRKLKNNKSTVGEMWDEEHTQLLALPTVPFPAYRQHIARVDKLLLMRCEGAKYSAPPELVGTNVYLRTYWDRVEVLHGTRVAACHPRKENGEFSLLLEHYLPVLQRKPGAVRHAAVFQQYPQVSNFRDEFLVQRPGEYRELVSILQLSHDHKLPVFNAALEQAVKLGSYHLGTVVTILGALEGLGDAARGQDDRQPVLRVDRPRLAVYDHLARGAAE